MNLPPNILNAVQVWDSWAKSKKRAAGDPEIPLCKDLQTISPQQFSIVVSMFVMEVQVIKKPLSKYYIIRILSNIQQYLDKERNRNSSFGNHNQILFNSKLSQTIKERFQVKPNYMYLSTGIERQLWQDAILDCKSSVGLSYAIYFYNVKIFGITSARDHLCLKPHFFTFSENDNGQYVTLDCTMLSTYDHYKRQYIAIKRNALANEVEPPNKIIHYEDPENPRSYYKLLKKYLQAITPNDKTNFYYKPCAKVSDGFTYKTFGKKSIALIVQDIMRTAGYSSRYNNQSLTPLMDCFGNVRMGSGSEYMCIAERRASATHRILKEIGKKLDPPMPSKPETVVFPSLDPVVTLASLAPTSPEEDRTVPQEHKICKSRHAPPKSLNPPPEKRLRMEEASCTDISQDLEVSPVKKENTIQSGGVTVKTEVLDYNNNPEATSQECFLLDRSLQEVTAMCTESYTQFQGGTCNVKTEELDPNNYPDSNLSQAVDVKSEELYPETTSQECHLVDMSPCHLRTAVDVRHGSFNIRLAELLPPGAKDVHIEGTKSDTEEQILLKIDFRVG